MMQLTETSKGKQAVIMDGYIYSLKKEMFLIISNAASHHETVPSLCKRRGECLLFFLISVEIRWKAADYCKVANR